MAVKKSANVYIDGFNLYYGCCRGTPYRWLNLSKLCGQLLPEYQINRIRYFTAMIQATPADPGGPQRQLTFIRALKTIPNLSIHYGLFTTHKVKRPHANSPPQGPNMVEVLDTKEKGSDVNLASYLLIDAFKKDSEASVVVSNDSDLVEPIRLARDELGLDVGILHPHRNYVRELDQVATFYRPIRERALRACQFPAVLKDADGAIRKPSSW